MGMGHRRVKKNRLRHGKYRRKVRRKIKSSDSNPESKHLDIGSGPGIHSETSQLTYNVLIVFPKNGNDNTNSAGS
ncbi:hypothetical protein E2C01_048506 [Portunus trituberculatus]|uniref:Uncharacterized protein n=1 Tax=Portunus trituberculatus TaxID=210409 RepID=A0A5B7GDK8_PORTR|nr:hypothetical protein [Portunus trituberculatus]